MAELEYNDIDAIGSADDISFPSHAHHFKVRSELTKLVEEDVIDNDVADKLYDEWREDRQ